MRGYTSHPVAQAISTVRADTPDWMSFMPVNATASQFIRDFAAKISIPPSSILQVQSSANYVISRMLGSTLSHLGSVMNRPSPGIPQAKYNKYTNVVTTYNSELPAMAAEYPNVDWKMRSIRTTDSLLMTWDLNAFAFSGNTIQDHLGPIIQIANNSRNTVELYFGVPSILDSAGAAINTDSTIYFHMAPIAFVENW